MAGPAELMAAAARYTLKAFGPGVQRANDGWQNQAYGYFDDTPEVRFAGTWVGNMMGLARLYAGKRLPDGNVDPLPADHPASELVASIAGGVSGQAQLLSSYGPMLTVAGEGWTVIYKGEWYPVSTKECRQQGANLEVEIEGRKVMVPMGSDDPREQDPEAPVAIRCWQPHPARHQDADSPIRSSFVILEELRMLNAAVAAIARSRLTGRGIVFIPQGTQFPSAQGQAQTPDLLQEIIKVAQTAYADPASAAAGVPIFLEVPPTLIGQLQHMTFESNFDDIAVKLREECRERFAAGMEFSPGLLTGESSSHWGEWLKDETSTRHAVIPRLRLFCDGHTSQWLQPSLHVLDAPDADDCILWFDDSELRVRTDRSATAMEVYDRQGIGIESLRVATNFGDEDVPTDEELRKSNAWKALAIAPELYELLLPIVGIQVPAGFTPAASRDPFAPDLPSAEGVGVAPVTELPVHEDPGPPKVSEGLMAAADGLITRALERAGQKLKSSTARAHRGELEQIAAAAVHVATGCDEDTIEAKRLLDRAWDRAPGIAARYDVDPSDLTACLDRYTRELLCAGVEHEFELTAGALAPLLVVAVPEPAAEAS